MSIYLKFTLQKSQLIRKNVKFKGKNFRDIKRFFSKNVDLKVSSEGAHSLNNDFVPFQELISQRRAEAKKSIIVEVQGEQSFKELYAYCNSFGSVQRMFHYTNTTTSVKPTVFKNPTSTKHFILVEFESEENVLSALNNGTFVNDGSACPVKSQFLSFRGYNKKAARSKTKSVSLITENGTVQVSSEKLEEKLQECNTICDQILALYNMLKLTDLESRLRFLTARQVESSIAGMFPNAQVLPFGSSVNGFGKMGCDLDVVLTLTDQKENPKSRLIFQCKNSPDRNSSNLETIANMVNLFLPGCSRVQKILQARVPIIKYYHQYTDVDCDLSMSNVSGVHMSDFLYIMGAIDWRVRPLVFAVRKWAHEVGITNSSPGRWITNFSLTLLVISFLQRPLHSPPILPTLNSLVKSAESEDTFVTEEGVNCTFLRDIGKLHFKSQNNMNLGHLLCDFFEYYAKFDFRNKSICLNEAVTLTKPEYHPLYIVNPLERGLNVSKNVSIEELEKFRTEVRNAAFCLQSLDSTKSPNWGLLSIFDTKNKKKYILNIPTMAKNNRLMSVEGLFEEDELPVVNDVMNFKNNFTKKQVKSIRKDTKQLVKHLTGTKHPIR